MSPPCLAVAVTVRWVADGRTRPGLAAMLGDSSLRTGDGAEQRRVAAGSSLGSQQLLCSAVRPSALLGLFIFFLFLYEFPSREL